MTLLLLASGARRRCRRACSRAPTSRSASQCGRRHAPEVGEIGDRHIYPIEAHGDHKPASRPQLHVPTGPGPSVRGADEGLSRTGHPHGHPTQRASPVPLRELRRLPLPQGVYQDLCVPARQLPLGHVAITEEPADVGERLPRGGERRPLPDRLGRPEPGLIHHGPAGRATRAPRARRPPRPRRRPRWNRHGW